jgi:C4-dicarboxylate-specific signal transduction histidine kinase
LYRTLSTAGITAATFAHESSGNPIKVITLSIRTIERRGKQELGSRYQQILEAPVCAILHATDSLSVLGTATLSLIDHQKRRLGRVSIHDVVKEVLKMFEPFLAGREVSTSTEWADGHPYLRASQAALESIVTNLLNNSLAAFERKSVAKRAIRIRTDLKDTVLVLSVADNGPGIEGIAVADIWLPGETTRPNGTGLGLTIVRDTVRDLGGRVDALSHSDLGGAEILVELPILGR